MKIARVYRNRDTVILDTINGAEITLTMREADLLAKALREAASDINKCTYAKSKLNIIKVSN